MIQYVYVRMNYPCMYLCIYFYNICTMVCDVQVSGGKKNYGCHWNFYFSFSLRQYYVIFCCFNDFSTLQGVICKLSFFKYITVQFTIYWQNRENILYHTCKKTNNSQVCFVCAGITIFKDLVFHCYSCIFNGIQNYTITKQGEHFWLLQIAPFYETLSLCKVFFLPLPWSQLTLSECFFNVLP